MGDEVEPGQRPPAPADEFEAARTVGVVEAPPREPATPHHYREAIKEQLGLRGIVSEYLIPVETNTIWYVLGGVLAIALVLEVLTGMILALRYIPDAGRAYQITSQLLREGGWSVDLNFHYWNSYVIFALVMIHMLRVFLSGGYRRGKTGLWLIGVGLAGTVFLLSLTGETLHWDERGFAVPWHVAEFFEATGLQHVFHYARDPDLLNVSSATRHLIPFYALHIAVLPLLLFALIAMHYYLVKVKRISVPFWHKPSGRTGPFTEHIKVWFAYSGVILGAVLLISIFIHRSPGDAPQLLPSSPFFGSEHGPGGLGTVPTFPISWTHGMNRFVNLAFHLEPDIWGTVVGMVLMTAALIVVPFVDRSDHEPSSWGEALDVRRRGWAFLAMAIFWVTMFTGVLTNAITPVG
ncbi:MAG TPA: cytochrome b N-terminal domain-containing protein [Actinomycetota bacterium]